MRKAIHLVILVSLVIFSGCRKDTTAVIVTTDLAGLSNETVTLVNTDDLSLAPVSLSLGNMDKPNKVLVSPDSSRAYIASARYPIGGSGGENLKVIDIKTKAVIKTIARSYDGLPAQIFDMGLNGGGTRLYVGRWSALRAYIDIYDTSTLERCGGFDLDEGLLDPYDFCWKLAVHPTMDVVYVLAARLAGAGDPVVRAYAADGALLGATHTIAWCGIENYNDYKLVLAPQGDLLLALSSKTYPFRVNTDGSLSILYDTNADGNSDGIAWQETSTATLHGKTDVLFSQDKNTLYINSAGIHIGDLNFAGGSVCLSKTRIIAEDPNPYIYSLTDFIDDVLPWIVKQITNEDISKIIDNTQLYGISASVMVDNTCFMFIAPILAMEVGDLTIPNIFAVFNSVFKDWTPLWVGGMTTTTYANTMAVNPDKNTLCLGNLWDNSVDVYAKNPVFGWAMMKQKGTIALGDEVYPQAMGMASLAKATSPF